MGPDGPPFPRGSLGRVCPTVVRGGDRRRADPVRATTWHGPRRLSPRRNDFELSTGVRRRTGWRHRLPMGGADEFDGMTLVESRRRLALERLRSGGEEPVSLAALRAAGLDFPAAVISELELNGYVIERVHEDGRLVGVRLVEREDPGGAVRVATGGRGGDKYAPSRPGRLPGPVTARGRASQTVPLPPDQGRELRGDRARHVPRGRREMGFAGSAVGILMGGARRRGRIIPMALWFVRPGGWVWAPSSSRTARPVEFGTLAVLSPGVGDLAGGP